MTCAEGAEATVAKAQLRSNLASSQARPGLVASEAAWWPNPCGFHYKVSDLWTMCETIEANVNEDTTMAMTPAQARKLGELIGRTRVRRGLSVRQLAAQAGVSKSWLSNIEQGPYYEAPAPDGLARVAEVLQIDPGRIDRLTKGSLNAALPDVHVYFRAKYGLTPEDAARIERYVRRYIDKEAT